MIVADARATPADTLPGNDAIHFRPAIRCSPPTGAGSAMIRSRGWSANRRKTERQRGVATRVCQVAAPDQLDHRLLPTVQHGPNRLVAQDQHDAASISPAFHRCDTSPKLVLTQASS